MENGFRPTQLYGLEIENSVDESLQDVIGKEREVEKLRRILNVYKNRKLCRQLGLKRANLLLFSGGCGVGKSFMARALAGEASFPLLKINASDIFSMGSLEGIYRIIQMAKSYPNVILFIDEAEKLIGNARFGEDNLLIAELSKGLDDSEIKSLLVLAVNETNRFGEAFLDRFTHIKFDHPKFGERLAFCNLKHKETKQHMNIHVDLRLLAK
ncbi:MAG: AAA family ATPase [Nanobdellota archaeon]